MDIVFFFQTSVFALSFLVSYALLEKIKVFDRKTNIIISIIISFYMLSMTILYKDKLIEFFGYTSVIFLVMFSFLVVYKRYSR